MDLIKLGVQAEIDESAISKMKEQLKALEESSKLKIQIDSEDLKRFENDFKKAFGGGGAGSGNRPKVEIDTSKINQQISEIEAKYKALDSNNSFQSWTTSTNGQVDKFVVKLTEADGIIKTVTHNLNQKTELFDEKGVTNYNNQMKDAVKNEEQRVQKAKALLTLQGQINSAQNKMSGMDKNSKEYKDSNQELEKLKGSTDHYLQNLDKMSKVDLSNIQKDFKEQKVEIDKNVAAQKEMNREQIDFKKVGSDISSAGAGILKLTAPMVALGVASGKAQIDFESAFAGVRKTVDETESGFSKLEDNIRGMASYLPQSASEIAKVVESAGQLGIENESLTSFSETMIKLGDSTNMGSEQAATSLARLANITQMPQENFDRLGSTIVDLGNNLASTESEIIDLGLRLAGAGTQVGMTEADILSFAGALSSVGVKVESGGTSFSKLITQMHMVTQSGGEGLENFANVADMTGAQFKQAFEEDAAGALTAFITGLGETERLGKSTVETLSDMGITEVRMTDALLRASGASEVFTDALKIGNDAWNENTALTKEAEERYKTVESQLKIMKNRIVEVGMQIGETLVPFLMKGAEMAVKLAEGFAQMSPTMQKTAFAITGLAVGFGTFLTLAGNGINTIMNISTGLKALPTLFGATTGAVEGGTKSVGLMTKGVGLLTSGWGLAAVGIVAATALIGKSIYDEMQETKKNKEELNEFYQTYEEGVKSQQKSLDYLKKNGDEYDRLNKKLGENRDLNNLTTKEQEKYHKLVQDMMNNGSLDGYYNDQGKAMSYANDMTKDRIALIEKEMEMEKRKVASMKDEQFKNIQKDLDKIDRKYSTDETKLTANKNELEHGRARFNSATQEVQYVPLTRDQRSKIELENEEIEVRLSLKTTEVQAQIDTAITTINAVQSASFEGLDVSDKITGDMESIYKTLFDENDLNEAKTKSETVIHGMKKAIQESQQSMADSNGVLDPQPLMDYAETLRKVGVEAPDVTKKISEMGMSLQGNDAGIDLINKAMQEMGQGGMSPETRGEMLEFYKGIGLNAEMSNAQILGLVASQDEYTAGLIAGQNAFKGLTAEQEILNDSIMNRETLIGENDVGKVVEDIRNAKQSAMAEAEELHGVMMTSVEGLKDILPKDLYDEVVANVQKNFGDIKTQINAFEVQSVNSAIAKSLDGGEITAATQKILDEYGKIDGYIFDNKDKKFVVELEGHEGVLQGLENVDTMWTKDEGEKEYSLKQIGAEEVAEKIEGLNILAYQDPETMEYKFVETGADGVIDAKTLVDMNWAYDPETKIYTSLEDGSEVVITATQNMKGEWNFTPETKTHPAKITGVADVQNGVKKINTAWSKVNTEPKLFITTMRTIYETQHKQPKTLAAKNQSIYHREKHTGDVSFNPNSYATGVGSSRGLAYVGELGRELIINPDNSISLTGDKAELRNLQKGTQIFNNADTEALLKGKAELPIENFNLSKMKTGRMVNQAITGNNNRNIPSFAKGNTKTANKKEDTKKAKDIYIPEVDRYYILERAINDVSNALDNLDNKSKLTGDEKELVAFQQKQIELYKEQKLNVHKLAEAQRKERQELSQYLNSKGFTFNVKDDATFKTDNIKVLNPNRIGDFRGTTDEQTEEIKKIEESLKRFTEITQNEIVKQQDAWATLEETIKNLTVSMELSNTLQGYTDAIDDLEDSLKMLKHANGQMVQGSKQHMDGLVDEISIYKQQQFRVLMKKKALEDLLKSTKLTVAQQRELKQELRQVTDTFYSLSNSIYSTTQALTGMKEDMANEIVNLYKELYAKERDIELEALDLKLENLNKEKEVRNETHRKKMNDYNDELDKIREIYRLKIKDIDDEVSQKKYDDNVSKLQKEARDIGNLINSLRIDTSIEGRARSEKLRRELEEKRKQIEDAKYDRTAELRKDSLEEELKAKEEEHNNFIEKEEEVNKIKDDSLDKQIENINKEKEVVRKHFEDLINDERRYAQMRTEIMNGELENATAGLMRFKGIMNDNMEFIGRSITENLIDKIAEAIREMEKLSNQSSSLDTELVAWQVYLENKQKAQDEFDKTGKWNESLRARNDELRNQYGFADLTPGEMGNANYNKPTYANSQRELDGAWDKYVQNKSDAKSNYNKTGEWDDKLRQENNALREKYGFKDGDFEKGSQPVFVNNKYQVTNSKEYVPNTTPVNNMGGEDLRIYVDNKKNFNLGNVSNATGKTNDSLRKDYNIKEDKFDYDDLLMYVQGSYKHGGLITEDHLAMVHGTETNWEAVLNKPQITELLNRSISSTMDAFTNIIPKVQGLGEGDINDNRKTSIVFDSFVKVEGDISSEDIGSIDEQAEKSMELFNKELKMMGVI